jgi:hypothetical protein
MKKTQRRRIVLFSSVLSNIGLVWRSVPLCITED